MKKGILILVLFVAMLVAGCGETCQTTAWFIGGPDLDSAENPLIGRVGIRNPDGIEFGMQSRWIGGHGEGQTYGVYALTEFDETPVGVPYTGAFGEVIDGKAYGLTAGTLIEVSKNIETVIEYQYTASPQKDSSDDHRIGAGVRGRF